MEGIMWQEQMGWCDRQVPNLALAPNGRFVEANCPTHLGAAGE
jgi:hypothetical protein